MPDGNIQFPCEIIKLAERFRTLRLEREKIAKRERRKEKAYEKYIRTRRLAEGLKYAEKIFSWASSFRRNKVGKELIRKSHTMDRKIIYFFDGHIEETEKVRLAILPTGLSIDSGARYSKLYEKKIGSPSDLTISVDTRVLKKACEWIDNGRAWGCIQRHFPWLDKK